MLNTSKASWSPGFGSNSSTRAVSTSVCCQLELTHRFTQKRRFSRFDLNHRQRQPWHRQLQWDGGRSSAGSDVHQLAGGCRHVTRRDERLQNQPVDRLVWILQRGQVDLLIPARQQRVERRQLLSQVVGEKQARTRGAAGQAGGEIAGRHPTKRIRKAPGVSRRSPSRDQYRLPEQPPPPASPRAGATPGRASPDAPRSAAEPSPAKDQESPGIRTRQECGGSRAGAAARPRPVPGADTLRT